MEVTVTDITTQVEVDAGYELFEVVVIQTDGGEEYAKQAEEAANSAELSATLATSQADIATLKASEASTSASNALASENEAESASTTATQQAILSEAAKDAAIVAQLASENSAESASISASNALASENASELAASTILNKVDFTGAVEGDLLEQNEAGLFVPKKLREINQSLTPFLNSPLAALFDLDNFFAWDSFNRPDGAIGVSDSGQPWLQLGSVNQFSIVDKKAVLPTANELTISVIERTIFGSSDAFGNGGSCEACCNFYDAGIGTIGIGLVFAKDENNYFYVVAAGSTINVNKVVSGVTSNVFNIVKLNASTRNSGYLSVNFNRRNFDSRIEIFIDCNLLAQRQVVELTSDYATFGTNINDIRYVGIITGTGSSRRVIKNFTAKNTSL